MGKIEMEKEQQNPRTAGKKTSSKWRREAVKHEYSLHSSNNYIPLV
jgi:hypothetical protein